jgi:hypothetical protein
MTFDELWRANLAQKQRHTDSFKPVEARIRRTAEVAEVNCPIAAVKDPNELDLTAEDRIFLSQVGIRP